MRFDLFTTFVVHIQLTLRSLPCNAKNSTYIYCKLTSSRSAADGASMNSYQKKILWIPQRCSWTVRFCLLDTISLSMVWKCNNAKHTEGWQMKGKTSDCYTRKGSRLIIKSIQSHSDWLNRWGNCAIPIGVVSSRLTPPPSTGHQGLTEPFDKDEMIKKKKRLTTAFTVTRPQPNWT